MPYFGLFLIIRYRDKARGLKLTVISLLAFFILVFVLMPHYFGGNYRYLNGLNERSLAKFKVSLDTEKQKVITYPFASFAFLPTASPSYFLLFGKEILGRMIISGSPTWATLGYQYNAIMATVMALATIDTVAKLKSNRAKSMSTIALVVSSLVLFVVVKPDTIQISRNDFYNLSHTQSAYEILALIPPEASVAATNNLGAQLAGREKIIFFNQLPE